MIARIETNEDLVKVECDGTESGLFKEVGKMLLSIKVPNTIKVYTDNGSAQINVASRGTYTDDKGNVHPSIHINGVNNITTRPSQYSEAVLTCVHPLSNNYKAYALVPRNVGGVSVGFKARYESIDKFFAGNYREVKDEYPSWQFWLIYYEKISKGYVDQTKLVLAKQPEKKKLASSTTLANKTANSELYEMLMRYANNLVSETVVNKNMITPEMVKKSKSILKVLCTRKTVNGFNTQLQKLISICPRKRDWMSGDKVTDFMAKSIADFGNIISREENLIMAMDAIAAVPVKNNSDLQNSFEQYNIHVFKATKEQEDEVMSYLSPTLRQKVKTVYRVKPEGQENKFAEYCKKHKIKQIKKLWHGSVNQNWASIIRTSLNLSHGCANGRMFGDGEYFASSAEKSWNYTSCKGTTWARGNSNTGFMGLFATAYGNPYMVQGYGSRNFTQNSINQLGYDCVHATAANTGLRADEIIFYDTDALCLNYIVEFAA